MLAPLALAAGAIAVVLVIGSSLGGEDGGGASRGSREPAGCKPKEAEAVAQGYYIVESGDILGEIAERTCVSEERIVQLNPELDAVTLNPGECVSLAERACRRRE